MQQNIFKKIIFSLIFTLSFYLCFAANNSIDSRTALAMYKVGNTWYLIDENGKELFSSNKILDIEQYNENLLGAYVIERGYVSSVYFNNAGKIKLKSPTNLPFNFQDGLALVMQINDTNNKDVKFGFINKSGKLVVPIKYLDVIPFSCGLAYIMNFDERGYINTKGKFVIPMQKGFAGYGFSENLSPISDADKALFGFIDTVGNLVIDYQFDEVGQFSEGLCKAYKRGNFGYINTKGIFVISPQFDEATEFQENRAFVSVFNFEKDAHQWGIIDKDGRHITPYIFDGYKRYSEKIAAVQSGDYWKYIKYDGSDLSNKQYKFAGSFKNSKAFVVNTNDTKMFINTEGETIFEIPKNAEIVLDCRNNERYETETKETK